MCQGINVSDSHIGEIRWCWCTSKFWHSSKIRLGNFNLQLWTLKGVFKYSDELLLFQNSSSFLPQSCDKPPRVSFSLYYAITRPFSCALLPTTSPRNGSHCLEELGTHRCGSARGSRQQQLLQQRKTYCASCSLVNVTIQSQSHSTGHARERCFLLSLACPQLAGGSWDKVAFFCGASWCLHWPCPHSKLLLPGSRCFHPTRDFLYFPSWK